MSDPPTTSPMNVAVMAAPSVLLRRVVMSISVVATGLVAEEPTRLLGGHPWVAFVLDPFPGSTRASVAHACEVECRGHDLATWVLENLEVGRRVEVAGELKMDRVNGPVEDDLCAVRVWIEANRVSDL